MTGAAYVFAESVSGWAEEAVLPLPEGAAQSSFGAAVALTEDTAVVGAATRKDKQGSETGAVYTYLLVKDGIWSGPSLVIDADELQGGFGTAVAADNQHLAVTAPRSKLASTVHIFEPAGGLDDGAPCLDGSQCKGRFCVASRCCTNDCASLYGCATAEDPWAPPRPLPALTLLGCGALALALRRRRAS